MPCYCANYYGSINCHNTVQRFGDRCKHCLCSQSNESSSIKMHHGIPQADERWVENTKREEMRRDEEKERRARLRKVVE